MRIYILYGRKNDEDDCPETCSCFELYLENQENGQEKRNSKTG